MPKASDHQSSTITKAEEEYYARELEWTKTELGRAFVRYTNCLVGETIAGENERTSDRRLRELNEKTNQFRREFLLLIRGW